MDGEGQTERERGARRGAGVKCGMEWRSLGHEERTGTAGGGIGDGGELWDRSRDRGGGKPERLDLMVRTPTTDLCWDGVELTGALGFVPSRVQESSGTVSSGGAAGAGWGAATSGEGGEAASAAGWGAVASDTREQVESV